MKDLSAAIAAAHQSSGKALLAEQAQDREALRQALEECFHTQRAILAAIDEAQGKAVLLVNAEQLADHRVSGMNAVRAGHQDHARGLHTVPLYVAPQAPPAAADAEEDAYVIERMGKLLAEIAVIVNGPEPHLTSWSYHDLPEKVRALKANHAQVAVPEGMVMVQRADLAALEATDFGRCGWSVRADLAARRLRDGLLAAANKENGNG